MAVRAAIPPAKTTLRRETKLSRFDFPADSAETRSWEFGAIDLREEAAKEGAKNGIRTVAEEKWIVCGQTRIQVDTIATLRSTT